MRSYLAGILLLFMASSALGQAATGYVTAMGYQSYYRPDCWTPLLVHLDSSLSTPEEYQIRVHQQDLDRDIVVYTHNVTLGPNDHRDFWAYFGRSRSDRGPTAGACRRGHPTWPRS